LRSPLTVISGALRMLAQGGPTDEERAMLDSALRRVDQLEFLVEGLELVASGPSSGGIANVEKAVETATQRIGSRPDSVDLRDAVWEGIPHPYVERVAFELLSNAVK